MMELITIQAMHISRIDLNLFIVFDAIYTEGGVTAASRRLNLSQPAVSHALGRLRGIVGDPLFERRGATMTPTPVARAMIEPVRRSLRTLETSLGAVDAFDPATDARRFTVAMREISQATLVPSLMGRIAAEAPNVELAVIRADRRDIERELASGAIDAAIDVLLPISTTTVRHELASDESLVVIGRPGHPSLKGAFDLDRYLAAEHVAVSSRRRGQSMEDYELGRRGLTRSIRLRCQNFLAAWEALAGTDLLLTIPSRYAALLGRYSKRATAPFPVETHAFQSYLYWPASADEDSANLWLRAQLHACFGEQSA